MVGVGTEKAELRMWAYRFCSMLGQDEHSWGYSYRGGIQHKGKFAKYGPRFGQGSIIGVHLDMCAGTIEYYHNRSPLGKVIILNSKAKHSFFVRSIINLF